MSALDMLEDGFPHGTVDGYTRGCRTNHCPAPITCSVVRTRYVSDWAFRKRVDAGWTAEQITEQDAVEAEAARVVARAVARREREKARAKAARAKRPARTGVGRPWTDEDVAQLRRLTAACVSDVDIAERLDRGKHAVHTKRNELGIRRPDRDKTIPHGSYGGYAAGCRTDCPSTPSCHEQAKVYWRDQSEAKRRENGAPPVKRYTEADYARVREMHAQGLSRREIAARVGMSGAYVGRLVRAAA